MNEPDNEVITERILAELERALPSQSGFAKALCQWLKSRPLVVQKEIYNRVNDMAEHGNGFMTEYSPLLSLLTGSHTAALPLGSTEQALAAMFYLCGYVTKNKTEMEQSLSVLKAAKDHNDKYPSEASDSGTSKRTAQHLLTRTLNRLHLLMEVSDYQIAAALIGLPTEICTENFAYTNPKHHLALIKHEKLREQQ